MNLAELQLSTGAAITRASWTGRCQGGVETEQSIKQQVSLQDSVYKNRYVILAIILIGTFMAMLDGTMVSIALPTITAYFQVSLAESQWIITGYLLSTTGLFIFFGKLSGFTDKVRLFMAGWAIFTVSSLACGLAPGLSAMIVFRIAQGLGASMVMCIGGALVFTAFPPEERGRAMGYLGIVVAAGALVGPGLGGFIVDHLGWQYIFLVNVPIGILLLACASVYMKVPEKTSKRLGMDWPGAITLLLSVASLMLLCGEVAKGLAVTTSMAAYAVVFPVSSIAFLAWESRCSMPLLDLSVFGNKKFMLPLLSMMLVYIPVSFVSTLSPFYFEGVMGYTPTAVGILSMIMPLLMMFVAPASGSLYDKRHGKLHAALGLLVSAVGFIMIGLAFLAANIWLVIVAFAIRGIGSGIFTSPNSVETLSALPREKTAIASSVSATATYMAIMIGVASCSIMLTIVFNLSGYAGPILSAGPSLLSGSIGAIIIAGGAVCMIGVAASALRNL